MINKAAQAPSERPLLNPHLLSVINTTERLSVRLPWSPPILHGDSRVNKLEVFGPVRVLVILPFLLGFGPVENRPWRYRRIDDLTLSDRTKITTAPHIIDEAIRMAFLVLSGSQE